MNYEWRGKNRWRKKSDFLSIGLSQLSVASASKRFPKPLSPSSSLSLRDISILASFDDSENAVGIRWNLHLSVFFWSGAKMKGVIWGVRENSAPTMWRIVRLGGGVAGKEKGKIMSIIFTFFLYLFPFVYFFLFQFFCVIL